MKFMRLKMKEYDELKAEINTKNTIKNERKFKTSENCDGSIWGCNYTCQMCPQSNPDEVKTSLEK